jgi:hypothetical protein
MFHHIPRAPRRIVGQVFNLRRIVNPPAALVRARHCLGESPPLVAARRHAGQDGILRGGWLPPPFGLQTRHWADCQRPEDRQHLSRPLPTRLSHFYGSGVIRQGDRRRDRCAIPKR